MQKATKGAKSFVFKATPKRILLLLIFVFSFVYRVLLVFSQTYPPGADIGFHESVIKSITQSGNVNFLWNFYQMGGGFKLEFPGYHIFSSEIMMMTGLPDYLAQGMVVAFFSTLIVVAAFLVTRSIFNESAALITAFFISISRLNVEMVAWAGYPNMLALLLVPLTFYLYLQRDRFSPTPFLVSTSILAGAIFLTHSLSAAVFVATTACVVLCILISPKTFNVSRKSALYWVLPIFGGVALVSPLLASAVPVYLNNSSAFTFNVQIKQALLANSAVPLGEVYALSGCVVLALVACLLPYFFSPEKHERHHITLPTFLLVVWILVPLAMTQCYLFGLYTDFGRFLYFLILPVIILFAVMAEQGATYSAQLAVSFRSFLWKLKKTTKNANNHISKNPSFLTKKRFYIAFVAIFTVLILLFLPIFSLPAQGLQIAGYYQIMDNSGYQAIDWVKQCTPSGSVFAADATYGWWMGGFAQRPTISAVPEQFLTLSDELAPAQAVNNLLDTDYVIDNGYLQVREDGGYLGRHNPLFLADLNSTYNPFSFFQFNDSATSVVSHVGGASQSTNLTQVPVTSMALVGGQTDSPSIIVNKANSNFNYTQTLTVAKGAVFAKLTVTVSSNSQNVSLDQIDFVLYSAGSFRQPFNNTLAIIDYNLKECGQLIFAQEQPQISNINLQNPCITQLSYNLEGKTQVEIQILVGLFQVTQNDIENASNNTGLWGILNANLQNLPKAPDLPITTFDYKVAMQEFNISYVANREFNLNPKYTNDPAYSLVFVNNEVAIFKVEANGL